MQFTEETEKQLALMMERDDLEWFSTGDGEDVRIWEGVGSVYEEEWNNWCQELEGDGKNDEVLSFEEWLNTDNNGTEVDVEDYDENGDWKVYTDDEADNAVKESIKDSVWAFNASFLSFFCDLPEVVFTALQPQCENSNEAILSLIEKSGGIDEFVEDAVRADGRGHFMNSYDGEEYEQEVNGTTYYLYRQN